MGSNCIKWVGPQHIGNLLLLGAPPSHYGWMSLHRCHETQATHNSQPSLLTKWMDENLIGFCHRNSARVRVSMSSSPLSCQLMNGMDDILIWSGWIELWMNYFTKCSLCQPPGPRWQKSLPELDEEMEAWLGKWDLCLLYITVTVALLLLFLLLHQHHLLMRRFLTLRKLQRARIESLWHFGSETLGLLVALR